MFEAWESFQKRAPKAHESIRAIKPDLAKAVDECIDAAGREWEPFWQRKLLNVSVDFESSLPDLVAHEFRFIENYRQPSSAVLSSIFTTQPIL